MSIEHRKDWSVMSRKSEREEAIARLREWMPAGSTVYTIVRHVSRSGMQREIGVLVPLPGEPVEFRHPNYAVSTVTGNRLNANGDGVVVGGAGMDMGFHLIYNLSYTLFPDGFDCVGENCPANDHSNTWVGGTYHEPPEHHRDGGYALRQRWL
jgi:hypothetical protein